MNKEEAIKELQGTKLYVAGKSEELQEKLFEIGFSWANNPKKISHIEDPFLFIHRGEVLGSAQSMTYFKRHIYREISANDILDLKIDEPENETTVFTKCGCPYSVYKKNGDIEFGIKDKEEWKLKEEFDVFEPVLVRQGDSRTWELAIFSRIDTSSSPFLPYRTIGGGIAFKQCIHYKGNESLLGKTD